MHPLKSDPGRLMYAILRVELNIWFEWLLRMCDLAEHRSHFLWLPAAGRRLILSGRRIVTQVGQNSFEHDNGKLPGFFAIETGSENAFLYSRSGSQRFVLYATT